jgi:hypothetical protein
MQPRHCFVAGAILLASPLVCQVQIPPHASVYNGYSRGYQFNANVAFGITQLTLPTEAFQTGDTGSFLVRVNGTVVLRSVGNASGTIYPNILVSSGQSVDIIANWSPVTTGNFTAHNSYGSSAPYNTMIEGVPHVLNRTGWQWDIGDPAWMSGAYLTPTSGSIGRVFLHTAPAANYAFYAAYGAGCASLTLGASARPVIQTSFSLDSSNAPTTSTLGTLVLGATKHDPGIPLDAIGMTGCLQSASLNITLPFTLSNGRGSANITVPNVPAFNGAHVYTQSVVVAPGANPLGLISSSALDLKLGTQ